MKYIEHVLKNIQKNKVVLSFVLLLVLTINTILVANAEQVNYESHRGLTIFYYMQTTGIYIWFYFILCFVIPNIYSADVLQKKNNHYHYFEITRIGYKKYCRDNFIKNSLFTFITVLSIDIYLLIIINFFISPLGINSFDSIGIYAELNSNILINLILYILFSSIGCTIFSNFLLSLQLYIKNIYFYRALGIGLGILLFLIPAFLSSISSMTLHSNLFSVIFGVFFIPNMIIPSLESYNIFGISSLFGFIVTSIIYLTFTFLLFKYKCRKEHVYE